MSDTIKLKLIPTWDLYPGTTTDYRVYSCTTEDDVPVQLNDYGNFVIHGEMQELKLGEEYIAEIQEVESKKHGIGYKIVKPPKQDIPLTPEAQYAFLRTIIAPSYVDAIQEAYPNEKNIVNIIKEGKLDYSNIKGIGDTVFADRIRRPVIDNFELQEVLVELSELGVTNTIIRKLVEHYGGNTTLLIKKVKENIYILCEEVSGIGFKKVDEYALKSGVDKSSFYRINACIEYILKKEENNGHCWIEKDDLIEQVMNEADLEYKIVSEYLKSDDFNKGKKFYIDDWRIGLYKNYHYESEIAKCLLELLMSENNNELDDEELDDVIKDIEKGFGFELTDEQKDAVKKSIHQNVLIISGKAGSGKSTILKAVIESNTRLLEDEPEVQEEDREGYNDFQLGEFDINYYFRENEPKEITPYETCSLSGKASQRIIEATGLRSMTIHRLLGYHPRLGFVYDRSNRLPIHIVALDEGSMVDNFIFYRLVSAIKDGGKLIILGDVEQLAPVGTGAVFIDMINSGVIPVVELTKVHRQAARSGILSYANMVRDGEQINARGDFETKTVGELQDLVLVPFERKPDIASEIIRICNKVKDRVDLMEFQVIVPMKERGNISTRALNLELQPIFNPNREPGLKRNGYEFRVGDKIIKRGNDYENMVFNGTLGIVEWIDLENKCAGFKFVGHDITVIYSQEDMKDIDMAYALTTHSNQGSQYKNGICAIDFSAYVLLSKQHIYTMLTRFSDKCMFLFENEALRYAIDNDESVQRNTFLLEMLQGMYERLNEEKE